MCNSAKEHPVINSSKVNIVGWVLFVSLYMYDHACTEDLGFLCVSVCIGCQKWFVCMKNIQLKSGITFSFKFKWKQSNYSGARVLKMFYFNVFISKCYGVWELCSIVCKNVHIDIPHSTSSVAVQLTCPVAYDVKVKVTWGTYGDKKMWEVLTDNLENFSYTEAKPPYRSSEILKTKIRILAPE